MRVAVTGSSGLIGRALVAALHERGVEVTRVVRSLEAATRPGTVWWRPSRGEIDDAGLEGHDAVYHLAGESLFGFWTVAKKRRIRDSRVQGTGLLARTLAALDRPPTALIAASGVNYYGSRPAAETVDESALPGTGFLPRVCVEWEGAARPAADAGIRVVHLRQGVVLDRNGGALRLALPIFRLGLGGRIGSGRQPFSWVSLDDAVGAALHALDHADLAGPVNVVSPEPATFNDFVEALGRVLDRPTPFVVPAVVARLAAADLAEELLLTGATALPKRLLDTGYRFRHPGLDDALRSALQ